MAKRREPTDTELALWAEVTKDVRRARRVKRAAKPHAGATRKPKVDTHSPGVAPSVPAPRAPVQVASKPIRAPAQLDGSTLRRLKEGRVDPEAKLDLHGLTQSQAHNRLATFLHRAHDHDLRCVLVVTGKGGGRAESDRLPHEFSSSGHGVLKTLVPRWLREGDIKRFVTGVAEAHPKHGGAGALYIYVRRRKPLG